MAKRNESHADSVRISKTQLKLAVETILDRWKKFSNMKKRWDIQFKGKKSTKRGRKTKTKKNKEKENGDQTKKSKKSSNGGIQFRRERLEGCEEMHACRFNYFDDAMESVRTFVITHRWQDAITVFPSLIERTHKYPLVIWKAGSMALMNHRKTTPMQICNFANSIVSVSSVYQPEVVLDHATYLMSIEEFSEAQQFMENNLIKQGRASSDYIQATYYGYRALLEYISLKRKHAVMQGSQGVPGNQLAALHMESEFNTQFERAVDLFHLAVKPKGNFDLIVSKFVELLECKGKLDVAGKVLMQYVKRNRRHPTPYLYLYNFLNKHSVDQPTQVKMYKKLVTLNPSAAGCLLLMEMLPEDDIRFKLKLLANTVDYYECRNNSKLWWNLANVLLTLARSKTDSHVNAINKLISDRRSWWPAYHFKSSEVETCSTVGADLYVGKAAVCAFVCDTDHQYIGVVRRSLDGNGGFAEQLGFLVVVLSVVNSTHDSWTDQVQRRHCHDRPYKENIATRHKLFSKSKRKTTGQQVDGAGAVQADASEYTSDSSVSTEERRTSASQRDRLWRRNMQGTGNGSARKQPVLVNLCSSDAETEDRGTGGGDSSDADRDTVSSERSSVSDGRKAGSSKSSVSDSFILDLSPDVDTDATWTGGGVYSVDRCMRRQKKKCLRRSTRHGQQSRQLYTYESDLSDGRDASSLSDSAQSPRRWLRNKNDHLKVKHKRKRTERTRQAMPGVTAVGHQAVTTRDCYVYLQRIDKILSA